MNNLANQRPSTQFGTMGGVFTPCTLTILGVIMFLRLGQIVGQSGVILALTIVLVSKLITLLTTLSLSSIATNTRVQGGGAYFLISRSLGVEFGGAIGVVFFLAQAISVAMYVIGFSEAVIAAFPAAKLVVNGMDVSAQAVGTITNLVVFAMVMIGAGWAIKLQYGILAVLGLSLLSFFGGAPAHFDSARLAENLGSGFVGGDNVWVMFALFFPAVTGIMAGANMSGDLKDPAVSIPKGTIFSVLVTGIVYSLLVVFLGGMADREDLINESLIMNSISLSAISITAGVFAATLSSAIGSMMGAPRILQAFGRDGIFGWLKFFGKGSGDNNEPRRAIVLTFVISQICILVADLNAIAPIITMAFMITYGMLNLATFYEYITKNPSFRPRFKYGHWALSLLGAVSCLAVMFLISPMWATLSIFVMWILHQYISKKQVEARWGDLQSGLIFERARSNLLKLEDYLYHPKNWRPVILAFSGRATWTKPHLAIYGHWFSTGHGILSLGQVILGEVDNRLERRKGQEEILHNFIRSQQLAAFPAVVVAQNQSDGIESLVQCHGLGALRPNTVLFNWPRDQTNSAWLGCTLRTVDRLNRSIAVLRFLNHPVDPWTAPQGPIDVWWRGEKNGSLMLLLAHMLINNDQWRGREIRLLRIISAEAGREEVHNHLASVIDQSRIPAVPKVVVSDNIAETIQTESRSAAIVFIGFEAPNENEEEDFFARMESLVGDLERVVFVDSHGNMSLQT